MNFINKIIEPSTLLLSWQPSYSVDRSRRRRVVGILEKDSSGLISFRYLIENDLKYAKKLGFQSYGMFNNFNVTYADSVIEEFSRRLPSKKRKDYSQFLTSIRIPNDKNISDFALLGYSGAVLPSDSFSLVNRFEHVDGDCQLLQEISGFQYYMNTETGNIFMDIAIGDPVALVPEPNNKHDIHAIKIVFNNKTIGYINRLMAPTFERWLGSRIVNAQIEKVSGSLDRPRIFLFISVS